MKLRNALDNLEVRLIGNRVFALGASLFSGGIIACVISGPSINRDNDLMYGAAVAIGGVMMGFNTFGSSTYKSYKKTLKHIELCGEIRPDFFIEYLKYDNGRFIGYCQLQGMYLAARKYGKLESFFQNKRENTTNCVPNF
jgi:hypothetical protein